MLTGSAGGNLALVNGTGSAARFYWPFGITVDSTGNLFVADSYNNAIRKVTSAGVVTTVVSGTTGALTCAAKSIRERSFASPCRVCG